MLTLIDKNELSYIFHLSAEAIRNFLSNADPGQFKGEAHDAILAFKKNPDDYTDYKLFDYGEYTVAINHSVRIEYRGFCNEGAGQLVAKGIWGPKRAEAAAQMAKECQEKGIKIHLKLAGTSSIEFNVVGVDKSLPIDFLKGSFDEVLKEMNYKPGKYINSFESRTVIAADGDSTVYEGPSLGILPTLAESPVREALCAYLKAGGVFMLVSGNDLRRSFSRIVEALPKEVYNRILIAANGGADLVYVRPTGQAVNVSTYHKKALGKAQDKKRQLPLDIFYIGDDGSKEGNDYPAFKAVGFDRSVLVAPAFLPEYDPALKPCYVGELLQGTRKFFEGYLSERIK